MCDCRKQHALSQPSKASFNFKKMIFGMGSGVAKIIFLKREIGNSNQFYRNTAKNYLPVAVILKVRLIIKVWRHFLTRARAQTFLEKDLRNLISEPPRRAKYLRRLWDVKWIFVSNYDKGWRGFHRARAPALMDFVAHLLV